MRTSERMDHMETKNAAAFALIIVGSFFLLRNLNIIPKINFSIIWPILLIGLGIAALYQSVTRRGESDTETWVQVGDYETDNPVLVKLILAVVTVFVVALVGFVLLGVLAPVFLLFLFIVPIVLAALLGVAFLRLLWPIAIFAAPFLFIIWILSLLF